MCQVQSLSHPEDSLQAYVACPPRAKEFGVGTTLLTQSFNWDLYSQSCKLKIQIDEAVVASVPSLEK